MNKIHNVIWNTAKGAWVVVAEGTKSTTKSSKKAVKVMAALIVITPACSFATTLPQGGSITTGNGSIIANGNNQLIIKQTSDKLGINWQSFNVGPDGHVIFDQPGKNSIALNRVIGRDGSSILGRIDANGQVFLINPNGIIFGKNAQVNVGGLVASTLNITDEDFQKGNYKFNASASNGEVINLGSLQSAEGGYVALLGKTVKNNGLIKAHLGTVAMAAGDAVTLDFSGDGLINVQITKSTLKALVDNQGMIQADGGSVLMTARATNATLEAVVNNDGVIQAQTIENRAGKIFLDGGFDGGTVSVAGTLDASAPTLGDGGSIETSGRSVMISKDVKVTTLAKSGVTGNWLIDPADFNINAGTGSNTSNSIGATTLANQLQNTNVTIATTDTVTPGQLGDINVNAAVSWDSDTTLTLNAHNDVNIKDKVSINGNAGGLALNFGGRVNAINGGSVKLNGANTKYSENGHNFTILRSATDLNQLTGAGASNKYFALGGDIDASVMSTWNGGKGFDSYGDGSLSVSNTVFNGLGNTISDFYVNRPTEDYVGLFGSFYNGTLSNLNMTGTVIGKGQTGIVAGKISSSNAYNVNASGTVAGSTQVGGVFGYAYVNRLIDNIGSVSSVSGSGDEVGGVIGSGYSNIAIKTLRHSGSVEGKSSVGGLMGKTSGDVNIKDFATTADSTVKGDTYVGGAIGWAGNFSSATDISGSGQVEGNTDVGGALGYAKGAMTNIKSDANVKGNNAVGGLIGELYYGNLNTAYSTGNVTATGNSVGGLVGASNNSFLTNTLSTGKVSGKQDVGGLVGISSYDQIKTSFSTSIVSGSQNVGGFAGSFKQSIITDAYATGEVSADTGNSGGFAGNSYYANYKNTFSTGKNSSSSSTGKGGFVGAVTGDVFTSSYWDKEKSGMSTSAGGAVGKTSEQLTHASTFAGWGVSSDGSVDSNAWRIYEGSTTPLLKFLMATGDVTQNDIVTTYTGYVQTLPVTGQNTLANVQTNSFFADLLDLSSDGLKGGSYAGTEPLLNAGEYQITSGLTSNQFGINLNQTNTGKVVINKAVLNFDASGNNKVYDTTTGATSSITAQGLGSDVLTVTGYDAQFTDKNAGTGKTVNINGITIDGEAAKNYTWGSVTTTADIAKADLTIGANGSNKTYDGTTAGSVTHTDNRLGNDVLEFSSNAAFADKNAGAGKQMNVTEIMVTGEDAGNYTWNDSTQTTADISKANLSVTVTGSNKTFDGTRDADVSYSDNRIAGDDLVLNNTSALFSDKNAGTGKTVTVEGLSLSGADANNYTVSTTATATADIGKANLVVKAENGSKVEGQADGQLKWNLESGSLFGSDTLLGGLGREAGETAGAYDIHQGDLDAGSNYALTVVPGTFVITQVVKPPVVDNGALEEAKDIISTVSLATKTNKASQELFAKNDESVVSVQNFGLLNLGIKLPYDQLSEESEHF